MIDGEKNDHADGTKILSREAVIEQVSELRQQGRRIALTSGTFDILHPGHIDCCYLAKQHADVLIVALNSDASVRAYKGADRPIHGEEHRAQVMAALEAVDYVFLFDEADNRRNIALLKPDIYLKGGDYRKSRLHTASVVESYGGQVLFAPYRSGCSTSETIAKILSNAADKPHSLTHPRPNEKTRAVFLDRDGVINEHVDYLHEPERLQLIDGSLRAAGKLRESGFKIIVITNQPGIGLGYFTLDDFFRVNKALLTAASKAGVLFDRIFYCPHSKGDNCRCRKPAPGMVLRAADDLNLDLAKSYLVGDMTSDIKLGTDLGLRTVLVQTGRGGKDGEFPVEPHHTADNLARASEWILGEP